MLRQRSNPGDLSRDRDRAVRFTALGLPKLARLHLIISQNTGHAVGGQSWHSNQWTCLKYRQFGACTSNQACRSPNRSLRLQSDTPGNPAGQLP